MAAKEMLIVFVYDEEYCRSEHDDPLLAIKYFHPSWVSDMQKLALCGQLMGLQNFCSEFSRPEIISLQNGKFKIEKFGRFILAVGTDRNIQESLLLHRAELLVNIVRLYHCDIETIFQQFEQKNFSDKLYHVFETYLPILQYNGNLLQNVYKLFLPKSASNLYLDAIQILENIATRPGILGGMILHHNKVLATQFSVDLTKILTATDPFRIKTTAEVERNVDFHIPTGSQILKVYVKLTEYKRLQRQIKKVTDSTSLGIQNSLPLPFSIKKKPKDSLKRDKSVIFSNIPEEEALVEIPSPEKIRNRPNHLPLKFKTVQSKDLPESGIASIISFDESDSFADFIGRTSVCATPMTENKILTLSGPMPSIFAQPEVENKVLNENPEHFSAENKEIDRANPDRAEEVIEASLENDEKCQKTKIFNQIFINFATNPFKTNFKKSSSDLTKLTDLDEDPENNITYKVYNTITDPIFPIFGQKRQPLSKSMFDEYQNLFITNEEFFKPPENCENSQNMKTEAKNENNLRNENNNNLKNENKSKNDNKSTFESELRSKNEFSIENESKNQNNSINFNLNKPSNSNNVDIDAINPKKPVDNKNSPNKVLRNQKKKMMRLPIKSFSLEADSGKPSTSSGSNASIFDSPSTKTKKYMGSLQLTPLMSKLTLLAMSENEKLSNFELPTPTPVESRNFNRLSKVEEEKHEDETVEVTDEMRRVDLFVCGQQNMTLMVIADEDLMKSDQQIVQSFFEICVNRLSRLEQKLNEIINVTVDLKASEYSFMNLDKQWDVLKRGGAWQQNDLQTLLLMHDNFANKNISDIVIRSNDSLVYGHNKPGESEIFYQHPSQKQSSGLPAPSDFNVLGQARRRLERDHSLVLF